MKRIEESHMKEASPKTKPSPKPGTKPGKPSPGKEPNKPSPIRRREPSRKPGPKL